MTNRRGIQILIIILVTAGSLALFVNKAFHVDDTLFLWTAKQIQKHPLDFYGFKANWYGYSTPASEIIQNPPIASYYIAFVATIFGFNEIALHIAFIIPAVLAALGSYFLAERFCSRSLAATLAAVLTPAFLVSGSNIMCDTMMLAFWVWAILLWMQGCQSDKHFRIIISAVLVAACALTKYFGMALIPLLAVYTIVQKRKFALSVLYLLIPVIALAGYHLLTYKLYGKGLLSGAADYAFTVKGAVSEGRLLYKINGLLFIGGCLAVSFFYIPVLWSKRVVLCGLIALVLLIAGLSFVEKIGNVQIKPAGVASIRWDYLVQTGLMAIAGVNILVLAGLDFYKNRKDASALLLLLWVIGTYIFAGFVNWSVNARSILPMAPAVGIILARRLDFRKGLANDTSAWKTNWPLIPAAILALMVCRADYLWADSARLAANTLYSNLQSHRMVWFEGHWGFQYYMESLGGTSIDFNQAKFDSDAARDVLVLPENNTNVFKLTDQELFNVLEADFPSSGYLTTMRKFSGAGFYSDECGPLPFVVGEIRPEKYFIFTIKQQKP